MRLLVKLLLLLCICLPLAAQVNVALMPVPHIQFLDASGRPLAGGKLYTYQAGTNLQQASYSDSTGTVLNSNPVVLDAGGFANVWLDTTKSYKFVLQNALSSQQWTVDNVPGGSILLLANTFAQLQTFAAGISFTEQIAPAGIAGADVVWGDSGTHRLSINNNNGGADQIVGAATTDTFSNKSITPASSGNIAVKGATADAEVYLSKNGDDANDGLSAGSAKLTMTAAQTVCPVAASCRIHVLQGGVTLDASVTFTQGTLIECDPRAPITYSSNNNQLIFSAQGSGIFGCGLVGQGAGTAGNPPVVSSANFFTFHHNSVSLFGPTSSAGELKITNGQNIVITNNIFNQNGDYDLALLNATNSQIMFTVMIANNIAGDMLISNTGTSASLAAVNIENNNLAEGEASKTNPCLTVQSTSAIAISDVTVTSNICTVSTSGPTLAYNFIKVSSLNFVGNQYDASGISTSTVDALKLTDISAGTFSANSFVNSGFGGGILAERCNYCSFVNNVVSGLSSTGVAYTLQVTGTSGVSASNMFSGNIANLPNASTGTGFSQICNATSAVCSNNTYAGNAVFNGTSGISLVNTTGTTAGNLVGVNNFNATTTAVSIGAGVGTTDVFQGKFVAVTNPFSDSGTNTLIRGTIGSGTATMTTALIGAGACGSTVTVGATGVLTSDAIIYSLNGAIGTPNGLLTLNAWPTANNVNFAYCNGTAGGLTPGAEVLNWRVMR